MKSLSYLNKYLWKYKWRLLLGFLFITLSNWFKVEMPNYFGNITDELTQWENENNKNLVLFALKAGGYFLFLSFLSGFFLFMTRQTIIVVSRLIEYDLKNEIYQHYQKLSYSFYRKNNTGDLINRISEDVTKVRMYLGPGIMYSINLSVLSVLVIKNMIEVSPRLTAFVLIPLPIMSFLIYKVSGAINRISNEVQIEQSRLSTLAQETFTGIRVIKAYRKTELFKKLFSKSAKTYKDKHMKLVLVNALFMPTIFILIGISTLLSIYLGGILYYDEQITLGGIIKFIFYVNMLTWPFASIGFVTAIIQRAAASQQRINEFLKEQPEIIPNKGKDFSFQKEIRFNHVSYQYPSGIQALKNISFPIKKGETLGIIGKTGSGKSTITHLLLRLIDPDSGEILIDHEDLKNINLNTYRRKIGVVPQDTFLFSDTIRNNVLFGSETEKSEEEVIQVLKDAHIYHNIMQFEDKLDTLLGERGVNLSGGQKQRLSIARALIRNPEILILDDCLSAVDTETEEIILNNLRKRNITTVIVSHRVSSIRYASQIITLENGEIIEMGTHQELLKNNQHYAELYWKQLKKIK